MFIEGVKAKLIKNSRKEKTIEVEIKTLKGKFFASAPSGKSIGKNETPMYNEKGIGHSLKMLNVFARKLKNQNFMIRNFEDIYVLETGIKKFENRYGIFGANATYALETAFLKAAACENHKELWKFICDSFGEKPKIPRPVGNCIAGGKHSHIDKKPDFQEFLLIPNEKSFSRDVTKMIRTYEHAKTLLKKKEKKWILKRTDEGAWQTSLTSEEVLEILKELGWKAKMQIGIDVASSSFFSNGYYNYKNKELTRDKQEQIDYMQHLIKKYKLFYVEDPIQEEDFTGFLGLRKEVVKGNVLIVGDDLISTDLKRLIRAIRNKVINAVIVKPNQKGYMGEVAKVVGLCKKNNIKMIFSHRSGETMDNALADYAVGFGADFIKCGIHGKERLVKLARVMKIEKSLKT